MSRALEAFNRLFVVWVIVGALAGYLLPAPFVAARDYMDYFFAVTMFGIGMVLEPADFVRIFRDLRAVAIGTTAQFTIMPLGAFAVAMLLPFDSDLRVGIILTGAAPGAMASNLLSYLAGADAAYSVSLTTASTLLAPVLTPLLTLWLAGSVLEVSFLEMFSSVVRMVLVPLLAGLSLKAMLGKSAQALLPLFPAISTTFIACICAVVIALNQRHLANVDAWILVAAVVLNLGGLTLGYLVGAAFSFDLQKKRALAIEIGMQNAGLGSVLALKHFNERTALPAVVFIFVCIFTASLLVPLWKGRKVTSI